MESLKYLVNSKHTINVSYYCFGAGFQINEVLFLKLLENLQVYFVFFFLI